ncbi:MAG: aldehyde dehydrogenase family protein [Rhizobiaceae bacterium]|nr:aldehyde dehydrogenase family protein [Rhizobiaceae bacterium]
MPEISDYWKNFINNKWVDGGSDRLSVQNPSTGEHLAWQAMADANDINDAVSAAKTCHESGVLGAMRPVERGRLLRHMGEWLLERADEIATTLCLEQGKPLWEAKREITNAARYFEYYGSLSEALEGKSIPLGENYLDFTLNEPYGVSAQIIPWNFPLEIAARSIAAGLATANACVVKSPELAPLSSQYLAQAAQAVDLPAGALNLVSGLGTEAGAAMSTHRDVRQIVFTGSVETGSRIAAAAAQNIVPCVLELGGKSAAIVCRDADLENFINSLRAGIFTNAGQVCSAMSRAIVHEDIYDEVVERAAALADSISVGPGLDWVEPGLNMGAMINDTQRDRAEAFCERAGKDGARIVTGGHKLNSPGSFLQPTIIDNVDPASEIGQTEVFGPVISIMKYNNDDDAINIANGTQYGLVGGIFTKDLDRAMKTARAIRAGQVFVNEWFAGGVETPFGGYGKSGYGREKGSEALLNYVQTKNIAIRL